ESGYSRFGHADVSLRISVRAEELAVVPAASSGRQADPRGLGSFPERPLTAGVRAGDLSRTSLVPVRVTWSSGNEHEQPLVRHGVGDVADRGRPRGEPGQDVASED